MREEKRRELEEFEKEEEEGREKRRGEDLGREARKRALEVCNHMVWFVVVEELQGRGIGVEKPKN